MSEVKLRSVIGSIAFIFIISLISSCNLPGRMLIFETQDYWWYAFGRSEGLSSNLKDMAKKRKLHFKLETISDEKNSSELSELSGLFQKKSDSIVILDPVLTLKYLREKREKTSEVYIGKIFMILGNKLKTVQIEYTRSAALETAGGICADMINENLNDKTAHCIFIYIDNNINGSKSLSDFEKGYYASNGEKILVGRLTDTVNRTKARRIFENYSSGQNNIYVLMTYSLTPFFIDLIVKRGGLAVIMDPINDFESDNVIFSVKYNFVDGIEKGLRAYFEKNNISSVLSNAYIKWGKNYPIPKKYREESLIVR